MALYELINMGSGNRVGDYSTEDEALLDVRITVELHGPEAVASIGLGFQDDAGAVHLLAEGDELVRRASLQLTLS